MIQAGHDAQAGSGSGVLSLSSLCGGNCTDGSQAVLRLCCETLHDAVVESVEQTSGTLTLVLDARGALGGFRGQRVRLQFTGVRGKITREVWWVGGGFIRNSSLQPCTLFHWHVLFDRGEIELKQTIFLSGDLTMGLDAVEIVMGGRNRLVFPFSDDER